MILDEYSLLRRLIAEEEEKEKRLVITPIIDERQFNGASFDVRLGTEFLLFKSLKLSHLNPLEDPQKIRNNVRDTTEEIHIGPPPDKFMLHPRDFVLASTLEYFKLPLDIAGKLQGRSSYGRIGLNVHAQAGFIDPGFAGNLTFELSNLGTVPFPLYAGLRIGQITFFKLEKKSGIPYSGKYTESVGTVGSRYYDDIEFKIIRELKKRSENGKNPTK